MIINGVTKEFEKVICLKGWNTQPCKTVSITQSANLIKNKKKKKKHSKKRDKSKEVCLNHHKFNLWISISSLQSIWAGVSTPYQHD